MATPKATTSSDTSSSAPPAVPSSVEVAPEVSASSAAEEPKVATTATAPPSEPSSLIHETPQLIEPVVDPMPEIFTPAFVSGDTFRIRSLVNDRATIGGAHYVLTPGATMVVPQQIAEEMIAQNLAERI